jgi:hypothetical protein
VSRSPLLYCRRSSLPEMTVKPRPGLHRTIALVLAIGASAMPPSHHARAACDFSRVKQQIDNVLDRDVARGAKFRREISEGADSTTTIEALVPEDMREQVDVCRFDVGEYLTKRGFPPFH